MAAHLPVLQVVVPMLLAPLVVLLHPRGLAWAAATAASLMSLAIAVALAAGVLAGSEYRYALGGWEAPYGIELRVDAFSALLDDLESDPALIAETIALPDEAYLAELVETVDVDGIHAARHFVKSTLAARLVEQELCSWDATLGEVFGDLDGEMDPAWRDVSLRLLLAHRGGAPPGDRDRREKPRTLRLPTFPTAGPGGGAIR